VPVVDSYITFKKCDINIMDLALLTASTNQEFALFTLGNMRLLISGDRVGIRLNPYLSNKLQKEGWRWSGHTHPGSNSSSLIPSGKGGDLDVLHHLNQNQSMIVNSTGKRSIFYSEGGHDPIATTIIKDKNIIGD
jgi:hypothetical protein